MKHTYNNWSTNIFEGFYESNLWSSDSLNETIWNHLKTVEVA